MAPNAGVESTDWQLKCRQLQQRGARLLEAKLWVDCNFTVGSETPQLFSAHKLLLAIASPVFEAMFFGVIAEGNNPVLIPDVDPQAFKTMLEYIYSDAVNIASFSHACNVYYAAKKYMLPFLVEACVKYLGDNLEAYHACQGYELALLFDEHELRDKCLEVIRSKTQQVLENNSLQDAELKTVITVFSLEPLSIESELDLFKAAEKYAEAQKQKSKACDDQEGDIYLAQLFSDAEIVPNGEDNGTNNNDDSETDQHSEIDEADQKVSEKHQGDNKNKADTQPLTIRKALEQIRFLTLTPKQFSMGPAQSALFTKSEVLALFMNISDSDTDVPMPSGFSTCREPRSQQDNGATYDEERSNATIAITVPDFKNLKDYVLSRAYYIRSLPWRVKIGPEIKKNKYLGIHLLCDWNASQSGQSYVDAELRLISHKPKTQPYTQKIEGLYGNRTTTKGVPDFLLWDEVLDPAKGYLKDGTLSVEVQVVATKVHDYVAIEEMMMPRPHDIYDDDSDY